MDRKGTTNASGCRIAYTLSGSGAPVVLIQGTGIIGELWRPQVEALSRRFTCVRYDHCGTGQSVPTRAAITLTRMARDTLRLMDALRWPAAHFVGYSMGGQVALKVALLARERVLSLCSICGFASGRDVAAISPRMLWIGARMFLGPRSVRRRAFLHLVLSERRHWTHEELDEFNARFAPLLGHDLGSQPLAAFRQIIALLGGHLTPRLRELAGIPTTIVSAGLDALVPPRIGRSMAKSLPGARLVEFPDAAHGLPVERTDALNDVLLQHLDTAEAVRRSAVRIT